MSSIDDVSNAMDAIKCRGLEGDETAWRELYAYAAGIVMRVAQAPPFRFDRNTAEDITHDIVLELTKKLRTIDNIGGFVARVAHNRCVDWVRKKKEIPMGDSFDNNATEQPFGVDQVGMGGKHFPEGIEDSGTIARFRNGVSTLGEPCRSMIEARFFDELSYHEIADKLKVEEANVGVYLGRCLNRLKKWVCDQPGLTEELRAICA